MGIEKQNEKSREAPVNMADEIKQQLENSRPIDLGAPTEKLKLNKYGELESFDDISSKYERLVERVNQLRLEREQTFNLGQGSWHGLQELADVFGTEKVSGVYVSLYQKSNVVSLRKIFLALQPDRKSRIEMYDEMISKAESRTTAFEESRPASETNDPVEMEYYNGGNSFSPKGNVLRSKKMTFGAMRTLDAVRITFQLEGIAKKISGYFDTQISVPPEMFTEAISDMGHWITQKRLENDIQKHQAFSEIESTVKEISAQIEAISREIEAEYTTRFQNVIGDISELNDVLLQTPEATEAIQQTLVRLEGKLNDIQKDKEAKIDVSTRDLKEKRDQLNSLMSPY